MASLSTLLAGVVANITQVTGPTPGQYPCSKFELIRLAAHCNMQLQPLPGLPTDSRQSPELVSAHAALTAAGQAAIKLWFGSDLKPNLHAALSPFLTDLREADPVACATAAALIAATAPPTSATPAPGISPLAAANHLLAHGIERQDSATIMAALLALLWCDTTDPDALISAADARRTIDAMRTTHVVHPSQVLAVRGVQQRRRGHELLCLTTADERVPPPCLRFGPDVRRGNPTELSRVADRLLNLRQFSAEIMVFFSELNVDMQSFFSLARPGTGRRSTADGCIMRVTDRGRLIIRLLVNGVSGGSVRLQTPNSVVSVNTWYHICLTRGRSATRLYINGALTEVSSTSIDPSEDLPTHSLVGNEKPRLHPKMLHGKVAYVRIWQSERTAAAIVASAPRATNVSEQADLVAAWTFSEGTGNTSRDVSGRGLDATVASGSWDATWPLEDAAAEELSWTPPPLPPPSDELPLSLALDATLTVCTLMCPPIIDHSLPLFSAILAHCIRLLGEWHDATTAAAALPSPAPPVMPPAWVFSPAPECGHLLLALVRTLNDSIRRQQPSQAKQQCLLMCQWCLCRILQYRARVFSTGVDSVTHLVQLVELVSTMGPPTALTTQIQQAAVEAAATCVAVQPNTALQFVKQLMRTWQSTPPSAAQLLLVQGVCVELCRLPKGHPVLGSVLADLPTLLACLTAAHPQDGSELAVPAVLWLARYALIDCTGWPASKVSALPMRPADLPDMPDLLKRAAPRPLHVQFDEAAITPPLTVTSDGSAVVAQHPDWITAMSASRLLPESGAYTFHMDAVARNNASMTLAIGVVQDSAPMVPAWRVSEHPCAAGILCDTHASQQAWQVTIDTDARTLTVRSPSSPRFHRVHLPSGCVRPAVSIYCPTGCQITTSAGDQARDRASSAPPAALTVPASARTAVLAAVRSVLQLFAEATAFSPLVSNIFAVPLLGVACHAQLFSADLLPHALQALTALSLQPAETTTYLVVAHFAANCCSALREPGSTAEAPDMSQDSKSEAALQDTKTAEADRAASLACDLVLFRGGLAPSVTLHPFMQALVHKSDDGQRLLAWCRDADKAGRLTADRGGSAFRKLHRMLFAAMMWHSGMWEQAQAVDTADTTTASSILQAWKAAAQIKDTGFTSLANDQWAQRAEQLLNLVLAAVPAYTVPAEWLPVPVTQDQPASNPWIAPIVDAVAQLLLRSNVAASQLSDALRQRSTTVLARSHAMRSCLGLLQQVRSPVPATSALHVATWRVWLALYQGPTLDAPTHLHSVLDGTSGAPLETISQLLDSHNAICDLLQQTLSASIARSDMNSIALVAAQVQHLTAVDVTRFISLDTFGAIRECLAVVHGRMKAADGSPQALRSLQVALYWLVHSIVVQLPGLARHSPAFSQAGWDCVLSIVRELPASASVSIVWQGIASCVQNNDIASILTQQPWASLWLSILLDPATDCPHSIIADAGRIARQCLPRMSPADAAALVNARQLLDALAAALVRQEAVVASELIALIRSLLASTVWRPTLIATLRKAFLSDEVQHVWAVFCVCGGFVEPLRPHGAALRSDGVDATPRAVRIVRLTSDCARVIVSPMEQDGSWRHTSILNAHMVAVAADALAAQPMVPVSDDMGLAQLLPPIVAALDDLWQLRGGSHWESLVCLSGIRSLCTLLQLPAVNDAVLSTMEDVWGALVDKLVHLAVADPAEGSPLPLVTRVESRFADAWGVHVFQRALSTAPVFDDDAGGAASGEATPVELPVATPVAEPDPMADALAQMADMGIDPEQAELALQASDGDVAAAVNLVFSGVPLTAASAEVSARRSARASTRGGGSELHAVMQSISLAESALGAESREGLSSRAAAAARRAPDAFTAVPRRYGAGPESRLERVASRDAGDGSDSDWGDQNPTPAPVPDSSDWLERDVVSGIPSAHRRYFDTAESRSRVAQAEAQSRPRYAYRPALTRQESLASGVSDDENDGPRSTSGTTNAAEDEAVPWPRAAAIAQLLEQDADTIRHSVLGLTAELAVLCARSVLLTCLHRWPRLLISDATGARLALLRVLCGTEWSVPAVWFYAASASSASVRHMLRAAAVWWCSDAPFALALAQQIASTVAAALAPQAEASDSQLDWCAWMMGACVDSPQLSVHHVAALCRAWSPALNSVLCRLKSVAARCIAQVVHTATLHGLLTDESDRKAILALLPVPRLLGVAERRIRKEARDSPQFTQYCQSLVELAAAIEGIHSASSYGDAGAEWVLSLIASRARDTVPLTESIGSALWFDTKSGTAEQSHVKHTWDLDGSWLSSPGIRMTSFAALRGLKTSVSSWTVEMWVLRSAAPRLPQISTRKLSPSEVESRRLRMPPMVLMFGTGSCLLLESGGGTNNPASVGLLTFTSAASRSSYYPSSYAYGGASSSPAASSDRQAVSLQEYSFGFIVPADTWVHLAFVCTRKVIVLYANGTEVGKVTAASAVPMPVGGFGAPPPLRSMCGKLASARVWSCARSQQAIVRDMNNMLDLALEQPQLVADWQFAEGTGCVVSERVQGHHVCTLSTTAKWVQCETPVPGRALQPVAGSVQLHAETDALAASWSQVLCRPMKRAVGQLLLEPIADAGSAWKQPQRLAFALRWWQANASTGVMAAVLDFPLNGISVACMGWSADGAYMDLQVQDVLTGNPEDLPWLTGAKLFVSINEQQALSGGLRSLLTVMPVSTAVPWRFSTAACSSKFSISEDGLSLTCRPVESRAYETYGSPTSPSDASSVYGIAPLCISGCPGAEQEAEGRSDGVAPTTSYSDYSSYQSYRTKYSLTPRSALPTLDTFVLSNSSWAWEFEIVALGASGRCAIGLIGAEANVHQVFGAVEHSYCLHSQGFTFCCGAREPCGTALKAGDVVCVFADFNRGLLRFAVNGQDLGIASATLAGEQLLPAAGVAGDCEIRFLGMVHGRREVQYTKDVSMDGFVMFSGEWTHGRLHGWCRGKSESALEQGPWRFGMRHGIHEIVRLARDGTEASREYRRYENDRPIATANAAEFEAQSDGSQTVTAEEICITHEVVGQLQLSSQHEFVWDPRACTSALELSKDLAGVLCTDSSGNNERRGRKHMVLGSHGFVRGVHYWEVRVDNIDRGNLFLGVSCRPSDGSADGHMRWGDYGFINVRAKYSHGTEGALYGIEIRNGATVGVLLDMEMGKLSFFVEAEQFGVVDLHELGVAFHDLQYGGKRLYPCVGLKGSGQAVTLLAGRHLCYSDPLWQRRILSSAAWVRSWNMEDSALLLDAFDDLHKATRRKLKRVTTRPGIELLVDTSPNAFGQVLTGLTGWAPGDRVTTSRGPATLVGATDDRRVWYQVDGDNRVWCWLASELFSFLQEPLGSVREIRRRLRSDGPVPIKRAVSSAPLVFEEFVSHMTSGEWVEEHDRLLVRVIDDACDTLGTSPEVLTAEDLIRTAQSMGITSPLFSDVTQVACRHALLVCANAHVRRVLPFIDFSCERPRMICVARSEVVWPSILAQVYVSHKHLVFYRTKLGRWSSVLSATETATPAAEDEYSTPACVPSLTVNRPPAPSVTGATEQSRFAESLLGQLRRQLGSTRAWKSTSWRRSYVMADESKQPRAFVVRFNGEKAQDNGGPYREVLHAAVGVEPVSLLHMFVPSMNAQEHVGSHQDQLVMNTQMSGKPWFEWLGSVLGLAVRHGLLMPISLARLIWAPLSGETVSIQDLRAVDAAAADAIETLLRGPVHGSMISEADSLAVLRERLGATASTATDAAQIASHCLLHLLTRHNEQLVAWYQGLGESLPVELLCMFTPAEVERLIAGRSHVDVSLLRSVTDYRDCFATDEHVQHFWSCLESMTQSELALFVQFVYARSRLPSASDMFVLRFKIEAPHRIQEDAGDCALPHAATCFFKLALPRYSSAEVCRERLLYAMHNAPGLDAP